MKSLALSRPRRRILAAAMLAVFAASNGIAPEICPAMTGTEHGNEHGDGHTGPLDAHAGYAAGTASAPTAADAAHAAGQDSPSATAGTHAHRAAPPTRTAPTTASAATSTPPTPHVAHTRHTLHQGTGLDVPSSDGGHGTDCAVMGHCAAGFPGPTAPRTATAPVHLESPAQMPAWHVRASEPTHLTPPPRA